MNTCEDVVEGVLDACELGHGVTLHTGYAPRVISVVVPVRDEERTVETGLRGDVNTEIKSGLAEGDEILTAGR